MEKFFFTFFAPDIFTLFAFKEQLKRKERKSYFQILIRINTLRWRPSRLTCCAG